MEKASLDRCTAAGHHCGDQTVFAATQNGKTQQPSPGGQNQRGIKHFSGGLLGAFFVAYLLTAAPADSGSVLDASPQHVSLLEEAGKLFPPAFAQSPGKDFILALLFILLHGVCEITAEEQKLRLNTSLLPEMN